ncbi:MAG: IclR family transcriptional regulator [Thermomicrobiales bacterium]|nr:IclR family transcriptional regulator [Thermomicrobiales bacterium]
MPALRKGLAVLETLAGASDGLSMADIQRRTGLNKTRAFRLLRALAESGYVEQDPDTRRYALGVHLLELGAAARRRLDIAAVSQPFMIELRDAFQETVNLGVMADGGIVYVAMQESPHGLRMAATVGARDPLHATSIGKAMLAFLPDDERDAAIAALLPLAAPSPRTITNPGVLRAELAAIRARGYAVDDEENEIGARCVGAPILGASGRPIAALSVSGPTGRIGRDRVEEIAVRLRAATGAIGRRFGAGAAPGEERDER